MDYRRYWRCGRCGRCGRCECCECARRRAPRGWLGLHTAAREAVLARDASGTHLEPRYPLLSRIAGGPPRTSHSLGGGRLQAKVLCALL